MDEVTWYEYWQELGVRGEKATLEECDIWPRSYFSSTSHLFSWSAARYLPSPNALGRACDYVEMTEELMERLRTDQERLLRFLKEESEG